MPQISAGRKQQGPMLEILIELTNPCTIQAIKDIANEMVDILLDI